MKIKTLTVSEVNNYLKRIIDNDFILNNLSVKGEISNLKYHSSGHIYFSLKDEGGKINCVMFRSKAIMLKLTLEEGMGVVIGGRASIYPQNGSIQLYCDTIEQEGRGELYIKFERLKEKLSKEGYFDEELKKEIPKLPSRVGIVTSPTGAAIRDIINVSKRRNSLVDLVLYPAKVQGIGAYMEVIEGIKYFNRTKSVDVIIIGRGGGSIEELWNFNEEELAKAIFKSKIPIISAVGHEVDFTISDFVSDVRAATPSQGAEIAVPLQSDIEETIEYMNNRMESIIANKLQLEKNKVDSLSRILKLNSPMSRIVNNYMIIEKLKERLNSNIVNKINIEKEKLSGLNNLLMAQNPCNLLNKGYAIIEDESGVINTVKRMSEEKEINVFLADGVVKGKFSPDK
ncbi:MULTISPECIES: exodeoxyribonuclease VII large subunit [Clostridium]|uniref:exodeoxyribonuclease VII large subunit n=1 Tax=Clostridium TaxID=1485 RepID=UPI00189D3294|nr:MULTISPECIES: exodeoxyribonuclease VII large subunit [Clostridium]MDB2091449.1 exodeoxyribonuclease VII large subunit [Clostridium paraputrificum]MDU5741276.1 exodeoxyribonuclease VII large subunit [Clostridium sp.]MDU5785614.1 exodeoxyribonuclease VII large subunit [Clostridium sp.]